MPDVQQDCAACDEAGGLCEAHGAETRAKFTALVQEVVADVLEGVVSQVPHGPAAVANQALAHARAWKCEERIQRAIDEALAMSVDAEDLPRC